LPSGVTKNTYPPKSELLPTLNVLCCPVLAEETHVVPFEVNTFPFAPGAIVCSALVPFPIKTLLTANEVTPVPPFATAIAVPLHTPLVIVPTVFKFDIEVSVVLFVDVIFTAVVALVAVAAFPVMFPEIVFVKVLIPPTF
jgi:hypothetical protein